MAWMATVDLLHAGYTGERVASSVVLVRDGDALIVADPGMVRSRSLILDPLRELGVTPEAVTHVFLSHHHPDHTVNIALFPNAELWLTPGHSDEDASLIVRADDGVYAMTHLWWHADRGPDIDPVAD